MVKDDIKTMLVDLIPQLNEITIRFMTQGGVKTKSNLTKSVGFETTDTGIALVANSYWYYASEGRRPMTRKVPIRALIDYCKRYGITPRPGQSINQLAFAIQTAIYKQGINPKNYADKVIDATGEVTQETTADVIADSVADEVVATMTATPYAKEV